MGATLYDELGLLDALRFGKYEGQKFIDIARSDECYVTWMLENTDFVLDDEAADWFEALKKNTRELGK